VTGGGGYVAGSLVPELLHAGYRVRRMARDASRLPALATSPELVEDFIGDLTRPDDLERAVAGVDAIFHLGSQTSVYVADQDPEADLSVSVLPTLRLLQACERRGGCPAFVFAGTVTVYGLVTRLPVDESFPPAPETVYDFHKLLAERYLVHYSKRGAVRGTSLRLANVYGPGPPSSRPDRGVLNTMVKRALAGQGLKIYGRGDFLRDYVYVGDVARAFVLAAEKPDAVNARPFIIATGRGTTVADAVHTVARLVTAKTGIAVPIENVPMPDGLSPIETRNFIGDPRALAEAVGFSATTTLEQGVEKTIDHFMTKTERS
jgi:nucleoside-diphosphate-sugar epimerase